MSCWCVLYKFSRRGLSRIVDPECSLWAEHLIGGRLRIWAEHLYGADACGCTLCRRDCGVGGDSVPREIGKEEVSSSGCIWIRYQAHHRSGSGQVEGGRSVSTDSFVFCLWIYSVFWVRYDLSVWAMTGNDIVCGLYSSGLDVFARR